MKIKNAAICPPLLYSPHRPGLRQSSGAFPLLHSAFRLLPSTFCLQKENPAGLHRRGVPSSSSLTNAHGDENAQTQIQTSPPARACNKPAADNIPALAHNTPVRVAGNKPAQERNTPEPAHTPRAAPHNKPEPDK